MMFVNILFRAQRYRKIRIYQKKNREKITLKAEARGERREMEGDIFTKKIKIFVYVKKI